MVAADDRTGAFEVAAELAQVAGPVSVTVGALPEGSGVVDLASRSMAPADAAAAAAAVDVQTCGWTAHKIDSTLRGNWAAELRARQGALDLPIVVIAAWPAMGRTCARGVVHVHGEPVGDVRSGLPEAQLLTIGALTAWDPEEDDVAVVDVADTAELTAVASIAARLDVLVAGPAGAIGAVFAARDPRTLALRGGSVAPHRQSSSGTLVVSGSGSAVAVEQVRRLRAARPDIEVITTLTPKGPLVPELAHKVAAAARARMAAGTVDAVVIVGGDTAAAVLGDGPRRVHGYAAAGMPWSLDAGDGGPVVITKAGGFGDPDALVELLAD